MEEEIITPEEEVFDYHKLRYILNAEGYLCNVSLGAEISCSLGNCTEYTGDIPDGYETIEEWHDSEIERLNAWKIVEGNLVYDENKYNELQEQYQIEVEENTPATHKWVRERSSVTEQVVIDELSNEASGTQLIVIENSGDYSIPKIKISGENVTNAKVVVSNKNILNNNATTETISGITFRINADKTITLNGTSSSDIEFTLDGSLTNKEMLFLIKNDIDYIVSGLNDNINLNLYDFDGTDRTLVSSGGNDLINLETSYLITHATLSIRSGVSFENVTISPQIEIDNEKTEYIKNESNAVNVTLVNGNANIQNEAKTYNPITVVMCDKEVAMVVEYFVYKSLNEKFSAIEVNSEAITQSVSDINTTINGDNGIYTQLNILKQSIETVKSTIMTQTSEAFEMLFVETGIEDTVNHIEEILNSNNESLNTLTEYIRFEGAEITLGKSTSQTKLIIRNDRISFMTGDVESAYISENTLYITDSTILNKLQVGHWETKEDIHGNLNTKWIGGE